MNYVKMYDDVAPRAWCEAQIDLFEDDIKQQQEQDCGNGKTLTQINMLHSKDTRWRTNANELVNYIMTTVEQYKKDVGIECIVVGRTWGVNINICSMRPSRHQEWEQGEGRT